MKPCLPLAGWMLALSVGLASGQPAIVQAGHGRAEIIIAEQPPRTTRLAAQELQTYVARISGAMLPIVTVPTPGVPVQLYVGRSPFTDNLEISTDDLSHGAFRMRSGADWLALVGRDTDFTLPEPWWSCKGDRERMMQEWDKLTGDRFGLPLLPVPRSYNSSLNVWEQDERGSLNAVHEFLRSLGVRWFMPGELGEVVPKLETIPVPNVDKTVRPDFAVRRMMFYANVFAGATPNEVLWQLRQGLTGAHEGSNDGYLGIGAPGHGIENVIGRKGTMEAHPDWFAIWGGQRVHAPCFSSEGLFQANVKYARIYFDTFNQPRLENSATDGYGSLCQCDLCKGKATPARGWNGQLSDYVWGYVDRLARELYKTHPDRRIGCLAYTSYQLPPANIEKLSPNVSVMLCRWRTDLADPATREEFRRLTEAWLAKLPSKEFFIWDYYLHARPTGPWAGVPVYFPHLIADDLRFLKGKSKGEFMEVQRNAQDWKYKWDTMAANHLNIYVTTRLYWDADQDIESLLNDYYDKFYGPAAREMKAFIEFDEANWKRVTKDVKLIDRLGELLAAARKAAGEDTLYAKRVEMLVEYMKPLVQRRDQLAKGREGVPKARAYYREKADLQLDGKLDEAFWQGMETYGLSEIQTGRPAAVGTSFKTAWAGDSLYFGIRCDERDMKGLNTTATQNGDSNLWLGDNIELMLETQTHSYYQIAISPAGVVVNADRKNGIDTRWSANAKVAVFRGENYWSMEVRVPVAGEGQEELDPRNGVSGRQPTPTYPWYFNVCRQRVRGKDMERSAFSPAGTDSFHDVMKFGELYVR